MTTETEDTDYGLSKPAPTRPMAAPELLYRPRNPGSYSPAIGLIGCGGISEQHLKAYQRAGYQVVALCDLVESRAQERQSRFFPKARVYTDYKAVLGRPDIEVVDIATHPAERAPIIKDSLRAGKHVLSQKPFVTDLDLGQKLVALAVEQGVRLAVNQNGRWAPHFSYIREAIRQRLIGPVLAAHLSVHWNHNWIRGSEFDNIHHIVLYDFGIHWFDILTQFFGERQPERVFASVARTLSQDVRPPMLAQVLVEYEHGQASLTFDADTRFGPQDRTYIAGADGSITSEGPDLSNQKVTLYTAEGYGSPDLQGSWFPDGFHGSMAELLCAIEEDREPLNGARANLASLALCFAAVASADDGLPKVPGHVRRLPNP